MNDFLRKNKYISIPLYIGVIIFIVRGFFLEDAIIRSYVYDVEIDTVVVVDEGIKRKSQVAKVSIWHNNKEYKKGISLDSSIYKFYRKGDSMVVSYRKGDVSTAKLHEGIPIIFILMFILWLVVFTILLIVDVRSVLRTSVGSNDADTISKD